MIDPWEMLEKAHLRGQEQASGQLSLSLNIEGHVAKTPIGGPNQ